EAAAANAPREPTVVVGEASEVVVNDPALAERIAGALRKALGAEAVVDPLEPSSASEDFGLYGKAAGAPSLMLRIGAVDAAALAKAKAAGTLPPGPHSAKFAPDREKTIRTGTMAFVVAVTELLGPK